MVEKQRLACGTAGASVRLRAEYLDMPGLSLTLDQARRLYALDALTCRTMLATLVTSGFLAERTDGRFVRRGVTEGAPD